MIINFLFSSLTSQGSVHCQIKQLAGRPEPLKNQGVERKKEKIPVLARQCSFLKKTFCLWERKTD